MEQESLSSSTEEKNDDIEFLKAEVHRLKSMLQAESSDGQIYSSDKNLLASQQEEIFHQKNQILKLEEEVSSLKAARSTMPNNNSTNALQVLEKNNKDLVDICNDLEEELMKEQKEYDNLLQMYNTEVEKHKKEEERWQAEIQKVTAQQSSSSTEEGQNKKEGDNHELQDELELKTFYLAKEKEVVAHLQQMVDTLRRDLEKQKEKQYLREKFIGENYEAVIEQLREERQRLQQLLRDQTAPQDLRVHPNTHSLHAGTLKEGEEMKTEKGNEQEGQSGNELDTSLQKLSDEEAYDAFGEIGNENLSSTSAKKLTFSFTIAPLQNAEREVYEAIIHRLQMEILELRKQAFVLPPFRSSEIMDYWTQKNGLRPSRTPVVEGIREIKWARNELLEVDRSIPECCVKVLDFTTPISRRKSTRAMFVT